MIAPDIRVSEPEASAAAAADLIASEIVASVAARGRARIALAGGSTPKPAYQALAASPHQREVPWAKVEIFFGDERCVPADDESSNFRMAQSALLDHVDVEPGNIHRIRGELDPAEAASDYAEVVGDEPLNIVLLGLGTDGHTASLFPATTHNGDERALATISPLEPKNRVSLGLGAINAARLVIFLVSGEGKAEKLEAVRAQIAAGEPVLPAARVQPASGRLIWMLDRPAARLLKPLPKEEAT